MLSAHHLEHHYGGRTVLDIDRFELPAGTITALTGANGSGKSTLFRILAFLERPLIGAIYLEGKPISTAGERRRARQAITLVEQRPFMFKGTVLQNMERAFQLRGASVARARESIYSALERLGVADLAQRRARSLSDGQAQRVAIARAIALKPTVLLLDEPASAADRAASAQLFRVLGEEIALGTAVCFTSHQLEDAFRWSERLISLTDGRAGDLTPENLFRATLPEGSGLRSVQVGGLHLKIVTDKSGPVTLVLPADEITVSRHKLESSARNQFEGQVTQISDNGRGGVSLRVDAGVDLAVRVTREALNDLDISLGSRVVLSIKATAVRVV
ncbi:MAG: ATP-binding cassette domain-containing protein [Gemmatimonadales bacterium]